MELNIPTPSKKFSGWMKWGIISALIYLLINIGSYIIWQIEGPATLYPGSDIIDSPISSYIFSMINLPGLLVISSFLDYFNAYAITGIHVFIATIIGIISYFLTGVLVYIIISLIKKVINQVSNNA